MPNWQGNDFEINRYRDFSIQKQPVWLEIEWQKWICRSCKTTCNEKLPIISEKKTPRRSTDRFVDAISIDAINDTFASSASQHSVHETFVRRAFDDYAVEKLAGYKPIMPEVLGIDEKFIKGVPHFVIGDVKHRRLIEILPTNLIDDLSDFFSRLDDRQNVKIVCQDMYPGYRNIVPTFFPQAKVVTDKWHVMKAANRGLQKAKRLSKKNFIGPVQLDLDFNDAVLQLHGKNMYDVPEQVVKSIHYKSAIFREAFYYREWFYNIYNNADNRYTADRQIQEIFRSMSPNMRRIFKKLSHAFEYNYNGIMQYFDNKYTNAYIERLNGMIGALERNAYGLQHFTLRAKALLSYGGLNGSHRYQRMPRQSRLKRRDNDNVSTTRFLTGSPWIDDDTPMIEPDWAAIAPRGGADLELLTEILETGTL